MEWVYKDQTGVIIDCKVDKDIDFTEIDTVQFKYKDPEDNIGSWGGGVKSIEEEIVAVDLGLTHTFGIKGVWKVWPYFVMTDGREIPGVPDEVQCIKEGDAPPT